MHASSLGEVKVAEAIIEDLSKTVTELPR